MKLFHSSNREDGLIWQDNQEHPFAQYPELTDTEDVDLDNVCRGCYGFGDGICAYHRSKFSRLHKRQIALLRHER